MQALKDQIYEDQNFKIENMHYMNNKVDMINVIFGRKGKYLFIENFDKKYVQKYTNYVKRLKEKAELQKIADREEAEAKKK